MRPHDEDTPETMQPSATSDIADDTSLALIEEQADRKIRRVWHDGRWFFSVIDVIGMLTDAPTPRMYWADMKRRIQDEGFHQLLAKCQQLKMPSSDGKNYRTDATDTETMLRIVQSIPSPRAEPIKQWLARVGAKRLEELAQPIDATQAQTERETLVKPAMDAPPLVVAEYLERLATLYRRQAAYEAQLAAQEERLEDHDEWLNEHAQRLEDHDIHFAGHDAQLGAMQRDIADLKATQGQLPDLLQRMGPQTLTPAHQAQVKTWAVQLHDLGGFAFPTIYGELNTHFHVGKYSDIADAEWEAVAVWFQVRLDAAQKRRNGR